MLIVLYVSFRNEDIWGLFPRPLGVKSFSIWQKSLGKWPYFERIASADGVCCLFGQLFLKEVHPLLVFFGERDFLLFGIAQGAETFTVVDTRSVPAVQNVTLVDADKCFRKLFLKRF